MTQRSARSACRCPSNSPFRCLEHRRPSFALALQKGHVQSEAMRTYVQSERASGRDVGHIHGLSDKSAPQRARPQKFVARGGRV